MFQLAKFSNIFLAYKCFFSHPICYPKHAYSKMRAKMRAICSVYLEYYKQDIFLNPFIINNFCTTHKQQNSISEFLLVHQHY